MSTSTLTKKQTEKIKFFLSKHYLSSGLGTKDSPCSIAAINLCLTGRLTDKIPECMSEVTGTWIIRIQDRMPDSIRNSDRWKELLPEAAGTGNSFEKERLNLIMEWMWKQLAGIQGIADKYNFGSKWKVMCETRTYITTNSAYISACAARAAATDAVEAAAAARVAAYAAEAADAARAAAYAADAAEAAEAADAAEDSDAYWKKFDPCKLLKKLITL